MSEANNYYLPLKTTQLLRKHVPRCENLGLVTDKYVSVSAIKDGEGRGPWLMNVLEWQKAQKDSPLRVASYQRWLNLMRSLDTTRFDADVAWRLVVGLGGESVMEVDITLHHVYGVPFIPGSALKGLTRAYACLEDTRYYVPENKEVQERKPSLKEEDDHPDVVRIFGSQERAGTVVFFDALPVNGKFALAIDIMNPHYPDYYNKLQSDRPVAPTNDQKPNPITFLTIERSSFTFALKPRDLENEQHKADVETAKIWLAEALQKYGVGAKTSAGYGCFKNIRWQQADHKEELKVQSQPVAPVVSHALPIPTFREGQDLNCRVIEPTARMKALFPTGSAFLKYLEYPTQQLFVAIESPEPLNWNVNDTRISTYLRTEERDGVAILVCKPRPPKDKDKKKKKK